MSSPVDSVVLVSLLNLPLTTLTLSATGKVLSGPFSPLPLASEKVTLLSSTLVITALISSAMTMPTERTAITAAPTTFRNITPSFKDGQYLGPARCRSLGANSESESSTTRYEDELDRRTVPWALQRIKPVPEEKVSAEYLCPPLS